MSFSLAALTLFLGILFAKLLRTKIRGPKNNLPPGSLGFPLIGETLSFLRAQNVDRGPEWLNQRASKHGPIFKTSLMGSQTVIILGQPGNKFVLGAEQDVLAAKQPPTLRSIGGANNIFELTGARYKLVKEAMLRFLKPESLQNYTSQMDDLAKKILRGAQETDHTIKVVVTMKRLTFHIACNILFGIKDEVIEKTLFDEFSIAFKAVWSLPLNIPGTTFWKGLQARSRIVKILKPIIRKRKEDLSKGIIGQTDDVLTCLLALRDDNQNPILEDEISDNFVTLMIASHDTSAILLSLIIWKLSRDPGVYNNVLIEQMDIIAKREVANQKLTWAEIQKMKYTWRVAQELMRMIPPVFGSFRKALKDTSYGGFDIPKGWQVFWTACGTHMDEEIFKNPMEFDPSRFDNRSKPIPSYAYIPFGGGTHTCIGNEFARVETLTAIHNLVTMYEWSQVHPEETITRQPMPYPSMGLPIKIKPRTV